jgi:predicted acylesterase/phospholipase RssA/CRP-like cAMP-binding protein
VSIDVSAPDDHLGSLRSHLVDQLARLFGDEVAAIAPELARRTEFVDVAAGEVLFRQGDPADAAYLLVTGRVRVLVDTEDGVEPIAEVGAGQLIGELALLEDAVRGATVVATRDSALARLPQAAFERLAEQMPRAMLTVTRLIIARSRDPLDVYRRARSDRTVIGLLPLSPDVRLGALAADLATRVAPGAVVEHLDRHRIDRHLGTEGIADAVSGGADAARLTAALADIEDRAEVVILEGDAQPSPWTRRCVQQVDHLVLVADATADPGLTQLERSLIVERELPHQRVSLVLLHPADTDRPIGTAAWLAPRHVDQHHHVRSGVAADLDRLARVLSGCGVTLVLSGGGAKGFAHLGVVRAMHELGIPIDALAGSSMGAPLAALVAIGTPVDELVARTAALYHRVLDYTVPITGMVRGRRVVRAIAEATDGRDIEDTWLPFTCVSTNLTRSVPVVHRRGDLPLALRATLSIPGVMPPVPHEGDLLVDGGVLNNLPVDVVRRADPTGTVIASDVAPPLGPRAKADYGGHVSGTNVLFKRLLPGAHPPPVPPLMATLMRSLMVSAASARDRVVRTNLADLYLPLEVRGVGLLEFDTAESTAARGYDEAIEPLTRWAASRR